MSVPKSGASQKVIRASILLGVLLVVTATIVAVLPGQQAQQVPPGRQLTTEDFDGDGIFDLRDGCPATAAGEEVDHKGCSANDLGIVDKVDTVWSSNPDIFALIPGIIYKKRFNCPLIYNVDDLSIQDIEQLGVKQGKSLTLTAAETLTKTLYRYVDAATPISPGYIDAIHSYGIPKDRIHLLRVGVDLNTFKPKPPPKNQEYTIIC